MHQNDQDSSWTTKDSYDDVPAFKELFERLESDDRDFLAPHPTTGTAVDALTRGGKSETNLKIVNMITDVEDGVDFAMNRMECYRTHQRKTSPRECGDDPYGVALVEVFEVDTGRCMMRQAGYLLSRSVWTSQYGTRVSGASSASRMIRSATRIRTGRREPRTRV